MAIAVTVDALRGMIKAQQEGGTGGLESPDEQRVSDGQTAVWWEQCEISLVSRKPAASAEGQSWPISTREEIHLELRVNSEGNWYDADFNPLDPPESTNRGKTQKTYNYVQEYGDSDGHNKMTDISLGKLGSVVTSALGINLDNLDTLRVNEDGQVDVLSYFDEGSELTGKWVWAKFKRALDSYEKNGTTITSPRTELLAASPIENT